MTEPRIPVATYRLQLNHQFTLKEAHEAILFLYELGISDVYVSPISQATAESMHGYDVIDPSQINPEIGTEADLERMVHSLHERGMGLIVDIVPNHMSIAGSGNKWWQDVLENGPSSIYARLFNIIWDPPQTKLQNKVLLPILDELYGQVIESQNLQLVYDAEAFFIEYKGQRFPVNPGTWPIILYPVVTQLLSLLGENNPSFLELQSIITAIEHLPPITETDVEKSKERNREKEIIKKRLGLVIDAQPKLKEAIQQSMNDLNGKKGDVHSFDRLEKLLDAQAYRFSYWRVSNEEINYQRFFDVNHLVSIREEMKDVFDAMHELIIKYVKKGWITGLRLDHVDGLFDPQQYFERLQQNCFQALNELPEKPELHFYMIVEKILGGKEHLRSQWLVFGTTGYDYLNLLNGIFIKKENGNKYKEIYEQFIGQHCEFSDLMVDCKKLILTLSMSSELEILSRKLETICEQHRWSRDYTLGTLRSALRDIIACFPVYRSYLRMDELTVEKEDREYILKAIQEAKSRNPASDPSIYDFIKRVLLFEDPEGLTEEQIVYRRKFVMRFQQLTGPVTAKGIEDTALYRYYPLASLNEVGMDPTAFGVDVTFFHEQNQERLRHWPSTLLATSTHDSKRSEDVRARMNVLSESPEDWKEVLYRWHESNQDNKIRIENQSVPDQNEEYLLYQTLIGTWPLYPMDATSRQQYVDRIKKYFIKVLREAKVHSSWINCNHAYEEAVQEFIHRILRSEPDNRFLKDFEVYIKPIIKIGIFNSLSQIVLKITCPGIPDFYQGNELWQFLLVDPDNRVPVDFRSRLNLLSGLQEKGQQDPEGLLLQLVETSEDGRIKLYLTAMLLNYRLQHAALFHQGSYTPFLPIGELAKNIVAFGRKEGVHQVIIITGRLYYQLCNRTECVVVGKIWEKTQVIIPDSWHGNYRDVMSGFCLTLDKELNVADVFRQLPIGVLEKID